MLLNRLNNRLRFILLHFAIKLYFFLSCDEKFGPIFLLMICIITIHIILSLCNSYFTYLNGHLAKRVLDVPSLKSTHKQITYYNYIEVQDLLHIRTKFQTNYQLSFEFLFIYYCILKTEDVL